MRIWRAAVWKDLLTSDFVAVCFKLLLCLLGARSEARESEERGEASALERF